MITSLWRELTEDEVVEFQKWALENYKPYTEINQLWHPVTRAYCIEMNNKHRSGLRLLLQKTIDEIFEKAKTQADYLIELHKVLFDQWDDIEFIHNWPIASEKTCEYIMFKAMVFDKEHHPEVMSGGAWMNRGFQVGEMEDWYVDISQCRIEYKKER